VLGFGATGLALSTSAVALANFGILLLMLRHRLGPLGGGLMLTAARIGVATVLMLVAALAVDATVARWMVPGAAVARHALRVAVVVPVAVVAFWAACRALGVAVPPLRRRRASPG
jgi:peptidoglycan biosynthesis protein MviN/MurJ (putative lipid II flippase)